MRIVLRSVTVLAVVLLAIAAYAHEGHGMVGEVVSIAADSFQVKTAKETITIKFTDKTVFELKKKPVDASSLQKGDRVSVTTAKLPYGELLATKVVLGLPKPKATTARSGQ
jgi:Domain of unknown function (DUF5666)